MRLSFVDLYLKQLTGDQEALLLSNLIYLLKSIYIYGDLKDSCLLLQLESIILKLCPIWRFWLLYHQKQKEKYPGDPVRKQNLDVSNASILITWKFNNHQIKRKNVILLPWFISKINSLESLKRLAIRTAAVTHDVATWSNYILHSF